jgi:hypothetical protein
VLNQLTLWHVTCHVSTPVVQIRMLHMLLSSVLTQLTCQHNCGL